MRAMEWVRTHKVRSLVFVMALGNVIYAATAVAMDLPASPSFKLLTPLVLLGSIYVIKTQDRRGS